MRILLLLLLLPLAVRAEAVRVPGPDGIVLNAELFAAQGRARLPGIVALHGCSGPSVLRDHAWAQRLAALGHTVLLPDSFGSRGLGSQCSARSRPVTASGKRREDALAASRWLASRPGAPPGGVVLMGWADGGTTVLAAGRALPDTPPGLMRGLVAFYPDCRGHGRDWQPAAPTLVLMGEGEDSGACRTLAERVGPKLTLVAYPGASHDFDTPDRPVRTRRGQPAPSARTNANPAAREDAQRRVPAFIAGLPPPA